MSAAWGNAIGVMIIVLMLLFIGIWIWVWRDRHRKTFNRMAVLPMQDPVEPGTNRSSNPQEKSKGSKSS